MELTSKLDSPNLSKREREKSKHVSSLLSLKVRVTAAFQPFQCCNILVLQILVQMTLLPFEYDILVVAAFLA
jgi:hypothetical protein